MSTQPKTSTRRNSWLGLLVLAGVIAGILVASGWMASSSSRRTDTFTGRTWGTTYTVTVVGRQGVEREAVRQAIEMPLQRVDASMSTYRADSDLGRLNLATHTDWLPIAPETARVMQQAIDIGHRSEGGYDVTVGALVNLWGFGPDWRPAVVPGPEEITAAKARSGLDKLEVRPAPPAARKQVPGLVVDLSSIAEGFAVDLISEALERLGINDYCVEVGGEIRTSGHNARGRPWQIAVETPVWGRLSSLPVRRTFQSGAGTGNWKVARTGRQECLPHGEEEATATRFMRIVPLSGQSLATSGDYRQYFEEDGVRYCHILDPRTGHPIRHPLASVTVVDDNCTRADAWATALMVAGPEQGFRLAVKENLAAFFIIRNEDGFEERCTPRFAMLKGTKP